MGRRSGRNSSASRIREVNQRKAAGGPRCAFRLGGFTTLPPDFPDSVVFAVTGSPGLLFLHRPVRTGWPSSPYRLQGLSSYLRLGSTKRLPYDSKPERPVGLSGGRTRGRSVGLRACLPQGCGRTAAARRAALAMFMMDCPVIEFVTTDPSRPTGYSRWTRNENRPSGHVGRADTASVQTSRLPWETTRNARSLGTARKGEEVA